MHRRYQNINIPTEIIRTLVAVSELGSFSKTADRLGLSQPAISAQVKRLQILVGGDIFEKTAGGVAFTAKGKLILASAKKLLEANDQILSIGGATEELQPLRLGVSTTFVDQFLHNWQSPDQIRHVSIVCNHTAELSKSLMDGYLDVACLINPSDDVGKYAFGWQENVVWARARDFVLRPGSPIPLIAWAGTQLDAAVIRTLEQAGLTYRCVFSSADHYARVSAVAAGLGLTALRERQVVAPLVIAREYYLPPLAPVRAKVFVRDGVDINAAEAVIDALKALAPAPARAKSVA
jgi:DNA-binding transcriptional LysR family regulator